MSLLHDFLGKATPGEIDLRQETAKVRAHAEELEENLLVPDPEEFTNPRRHVEICFERQKAAHAWRKSLALQSQLNGAENRRYSRGNLMWMMVGFGAVMLKGIVPAEQIGQILKLLGALL